MSIVSTDVNYNYSLLTQNLSTLSKTYPFLNYQVIANSVLGKKIYAVRLGYGKKEVFYSASIHANEWITSVLLMKFIEDYCIAYTNNSLLYGYSVRNLFNTVSIYLVPMVNPDGVDLVTGALSTTFYGYLNARKIANKFPDIPFPTGWKANIKGESLINFHLYFEN